MLFAMKIIRILAVLTSLVCIPYAGAQEQSFQDWLQELRNEALSLGISDTTLREALDNLEPVERVVELDRSQPEFVRVTSAGMQESHVHDVTITKEAPNYRRD